MSKASKYAYDLTNEFNYPRGCLYGRSNQALRE